MGNKRFHLAIDLAIATVAILFIGWSVWVFSTSYSTTASIDEIQWLHALVHEEEDCIPIWMPDGNGGGSYSESCDWSEVDRISVSGHYPDPLYWPDAPQSWKTGGYLRIRKSEDYTVFLTLFEPKAGELNTRQKKLRSEAEYPGVAALKNCQVIAKINHFGGVNSIEEFICPSAIAN